MPPSNDQELQRAFRDGSLEAKIDIFIAEMRENQKLTSDLLTRMARLEVKAGLVGFVGGAIPGTIALLIWWLQKNQ